jgi:hypothetical protein
MSMSEELPREITNEAKVTGIPELSGGSEEGAGWDAVDDEGGGGADGFSDPPLPRRSRMTNPSSLYAANVCSSAPDAAIPYHRPLGLASCDDALKQNRNRV